MTFIVTLITLLIERFFDWSHLREWRWYATYEQFFLKRFPKQSPALLLVMVIMPLLVVVAIVGSLLNNALYGFLRLLFEFLVVLYCLGPQNLWADAFSSINIVSQSDRETGIAKLHNSFSVAATGDQSSLHQQLLNQLFIAANCRVFAVVFWYLILGVVGAVFYRIITLSARDVAIESASPLASCARTVCAVLDWVPVRLFTFIFALCGHFVQVFNFWRKDVLQGLWGNEQMLTDCGAAAINHDQPFADDGSVERAAVNLLDRSFIVLLVIIAVGAWVA